MNLVGNEKGKNYTVIRRDPALGVFISQLFTVYWYLAH
jgi:hypothetical protein